MLLWKTPHSHCKQHDQQSTGKPFISFRDGKPHLASMRMINKLVKSQTNSWPQPNFSESMGRQQPIKFSLSFLPPSLILCLMDNGGCKMDEKLITTIQSSPVHYFDWNRNKMMLRREWPHQSLKSVLKDNSNMIEHFAHFLLCPPALRHVPVLSLYHSLRYLSISLVVFQIKIYLSLSEEGGVIIIVYSKSLDLASLWG